MRFGICGEIGAGKDTLAKAITTIDPSYQILHFAGPLKTLCKIIFKSTDEELYDTEVKERPYATPIDMDLYLFQMRFHTGLTNIVARGHVATSPRRLMQLFGSEYVRAASSTYWIDLQRNMLDARPNVLMPDCRYLNEAELLRGMGGKIVRVVRERSASKKQRPNFFAWLLGARPEPAEVVAHSSERSASELKADYTFHVPDCGPSEYFDRAAYFWAQIAGQ